MTKKNGQSLLEAIVALAVAMLVILALVWVTTVSIRNADFAKKQSQAASYAQEGMEKVRAYRDQNNWIVFTTNCGNAAQMGFPVLTSFARSVSCEDAGSDKRKVIVTVSWTDSAGTHKSEQISYFTKWP